MPIQPVKSYFDGDRTVPFQYGPVMVTRPFANTPTLDTYAIERMTAFDVLPSQFSSGSRIAVRTSYTNLLTFSEQFDNAAWTKLNVTVTPNQAANPADGLVAGDAMLETVTNGLHRFTMSYAATNGTPQVFDVFLKANGRIWAQLVADDGTANVGQCSFNLSAGVSSAPTSGSPLIIPAGNGWFRCIIGFTPLHTATGSIAVYLSTDGTTVSYAGDTTKGIFAWGAQLEVSTSAGPYISTTNVARTISSPDWWDTTAATYSDGDSPDPFAFLCDESDPSTDSVSGDYLFKRTWARIPKTQVVQTSIAITKPAVPNQSAGTVTFAVQSGTGDALPSGGPGAYYAGYLFSPLNVLNGSTVGTNTFYGPMQSGSSNVPAAVSSGVFTLNYRGTATGNLNYNDTIATIVAALNALATVISDGLTFSAGLSSNTLSSNGLILLGISVGATTFRIVINPAGFSPSAATTAFTVITSPTVQAIQTAYIASIPAHGFDITKVLALCGSSIATFSGTVFVLQPRAAVTGAGQWSILDANTIAYSTGEANITAGLFGQPLRTYTPGPDRVGAQLSTSFFLPGVTSGITTDADIPIPNPLLNDTDFLTAVLTTPTGYLNYDASDLTPWNGPIMQQTQKLINLADV